MENNDSIIKIATYNVHLGYSAHFESNIDAMVKEVSQSGKIDIIALQEVGRSNLELGVSDILDQFGAKLNLKYGAYSSVQGLITGFHTAILSRFPFQNLNVLYLPNPNYRSSMVGGKITLKSKNNNNFSFFNVYSLHLHTTVKKGGFQILEILKEIKENPYLFENVLMMGDYNFDFFKCKQIDACRFLQSKLQPLDFKS